MVSKAKAALLNGTLEVPKETFLGEMIEENSIPEDFLPGTVVGEDLDLDIGETFKLNEIEEEYEKQDQEDEEPEEIEDNQEEPKEEEEAEMNHFMKAFSEEEESKEEKKVEPQSQGRRRGRPRVEETKEEEPEKIEVTEKPRAKTTSKTSGALSMDVLVRAIALNLIDTLRAEEDIEVNGLNSEQLQPIWDFIRNKVNE